MSSLSQLVEALKAGVQTLEAEIKRSNSEAPNVWNTAPINVLDELEYFPSWSTFEAIEKIRLNLRGIDALITPTHLRLLDLGLRPITTSLLGVACHLHLAQIIEDHGGRVALSDLAKTTQVNENKLGRLLRTLAFEFIFQETSPGIFANTRLSKSLQGHASSFTQFLCIEGVQSSGGLLENLTNETTKDGFAEKDAPFCKTVAEHGETFYEYFGKPEHAEKAYRILHSVVPWLNRITRPALLNDYPWSEKPDAHVIDVGCGPGDTGIDILRKYPKMRWTFQDLPAVLEQMQKALPEDIKAKIQAGSVTCTAQDYFQENVREGDIWYLRGVLHEYDDEQAVSILKHVAAAMRRTSGAKLVINEITASQILAPADPESATLFDVLPKDQSRHADLANLMTWSTYCMFGGKERSLAEYGQLVARAGLRIRQFFPFRVFTGMIECELE